MNSKRTNELWRLYTLSRKEDFNIWLKETVEKEIQAYIKPTIRYIKLSTSYDYDSCYVDGVWVYDEHEDHIDLFAPNNIKAGMEDDAPDWDELATNVFDDYAHEISELQANDFKIDITKGLSIDYEAGRIL